MNTKIIKIGDNCNNNCYFCFEKNKKHLLDYDLIKNELNKGRQLGCEQVIFTGREPTVLIEFVELIEYAKQLEYKVIQVMSNARMFAYQKFTEEIIKAGLTELIVPIYHYKKEIHDQITGVEGSLAQTINGIENINKYSNQNSPYFNVLVSAGIVMCKENIKDLNKIINFLKQKDIKQIFIINNKIEKINNFNDYLLKLKSYLDNNDLKVYFVGFSKLSRDLDKYSFEKFIQKNKERILLPK